MAKFLNTSKAYASIEDIVTKAQRKLVLISPYLKLPEPLLVRLRDAGERQNIHITVVCRKADLRPETTSELGQVDNLELRFLENLHAKCFYNEESMVITSLNLYEYSQQHNREMGVLLTAEEDGAVFKEALDEAEFIVRTSAVDAQRGRPVRRATSTSKKATGDRNASPTISDVLTADVGDVLKKAFPTFAKVIGSSESKPRAKGKRSATKSKAGHCIRCGREIPYDLDKPYCRSCFTKWAEWENPDYEEFYCHECGETESTTMLKPRCYACYSRSVK